MSESFASALEKRLLTVSHSQCVGADDTHTIRVHITQSLAEALKTRDGPRRDLFVYASVFFDAGRETHHLAQSIDDDELAVRVTRDDHMKAVRPQVDSGENVRQSSGGQASRLLRSGRDSWTHQKRSFRR
jgi:hypothetical protein